jgi:hypothetical protein
MSGEAEDTIMLSDEWAERARKAYSVGHLRVGQTFRTRDHTVQVTEAAKGLSGFIRGRFVLGGMSRSLSGEQHPWDRWGVARNHHNPHDLSDAYFDAIGPGSVADSPAMRVADAVEALRSCGPIATQPEPK